MSVPHYLALIGSGCSAEVFRLAGGRVLKLYREGLDPGVIEREHDGVRHAQRQGLRVARALGKREHKGRLGIIFEELAGTPLLRDLLLRPFRSRSLLGRFAAYHARMHRCSGAGLDHAQHIIVHVRILHAEVGEDMRRLALDRLYAIPEGDRLCHGDFHPQNAILTDEGIAAIDWSNGSRGDPAGDVARTELLLRFGGLGGMMRRFPWLRRFRNAAANLYLRRYCEATGMSEEAIDAWRLPMAIAALHPESRIDRDALVMELRGQGHAI
ncbi:phosphotransferase family protein [Rhizorhabdus dicambivorans]|uniref:Aminoglycoside phosphotransferase n=1 Tax=Rhizorhabdus dicambivorans TaxID=1850238 RepID=A0A2A4G119_9SPHN|nr:phosphotransferase [Rhizorhabdus dicambivorans]ATE64905.1 aminoglycoside phosphotransferase [Rhizorhabdus dicambivorans]PCE44179.1 aminoglycoside phosphotransferase [Rhizorhabdus dicambivorans]